MRVSDRFQSIAIVGFMAGTTTLTIPISQAQAGIADADYKLTVFAEYGADQGVFAGRQIRIETWFDVDVPGDPYLAGHDRDFFEGGMVQSEITFLDNGAVFSMSSLDVITIYGTIGFGAYEDEIVSDGVESLDLIDFSFSFAPDSDDVHDLEAMILSIPTASGAGIYMGYNGIGGQQYSPISTSIELVSVPAGGTLALLGLGGLVTSRRPTNLPTSAR